MDKVDKEQVAENVNKIRQTKTRDVLVEQQKGGNATHLKEAVTTAIGSEATVLQLSKQVALDVRDVDMDTTEGEVQKALAETAGVIVEALKVKAMRPMDVGIQIAIVTMPRMNALPIIKSGKVRIGLVIARDREKISVPSVSGAQLLGTSRTTTAKGIMQQNRACYAGPWITSPRSAVASRWAPSARRWVSTTDIDLGAQNALP